MGLTYLLDTDVAVEVTRKRARSLLARLAQAGHVGISTVCVAELRFGAENSSEPRVTHAGVDELLATADVIDFDAAAAEHAGEIRFSLRRAGTPIGPYDVLIAGHARSRGLILMTRNDRELRRVEGLRVERW